MGWFSSAKNWASSVCRSVKETITETVDNVKSACSKAWNGFTGKTTFDKAEKLYKEITEKYDKAKLDYEKAVTDIGDEIETKISNINLFKSQIYDVHFKRFIALANRLHSVTVKGEPLEELFARSILEVKVQDKIADKKDVFQIDFNKFSFTRAASYILTLGFWSRKKAAESLEKVKQQEAMVSEEIAKMESQQRQLKVIASSIDSVLEYFDVLIANYASLLDRFEYGIQTQRVKQMSLSTDVFAHKMDFRLIPIVHIEEFQALFNLSIVLKQMATLGYLTESGELNSEDQGTVSKLFNMAKTSSQIAA